MAEQQRERQALKRRGLIAGAAALVAGIVAQRTAQPVAAANNPLLYSTDPGASPANQVSSPVTIQPASNFGTNRYLIDANIFGSGQAAISGTTLTSTGLLGTVDLFSTADATVGVKGLNQSTGAGGIGVLGQSTSGAGVEGLIPATSNAANTIAVFGNNLSVGANGIGIYGSCANGTGIYGQTSASYQYGVLGTTYAPTSTAVAGTCTGNGSSAFSGGTGNANAFAAYFQGHVQIDGPFDVIGAGNKHAAVAHPDGSHRTIYSIEAAEAWVEDFGTGTLSSGKADIKLDVDFAALIETGDYHVFVTEHGDHHLHVSQHSATGFTVEADTALAALKGKKASDLVGTFSWRVVARPKTTAKVGRLAKVNIADAKALLPDPAKLPKPQQPLDFPPATPGKRP